MAQEDDDAHHRAKVSKCTHCASSYEVPRKYKWKLGEETISFLYCVHHYAATATSTNASTPYANRKRPLNCPSTKIKRLLS